MRFYITTPIYYVSDVPHLGHSYTTIVCDALARWHRQRGDQTRYLTGTDEHGQKIARLAEAAGVSPRQYADKFADAYRATWKALEVANDDFIRTTDPDHEATVQEVWRRMEKNGAIYLADYEGWYCVACEQYYTEKELDGESCPIHHRPVEKVKESSFYFKLSAYRDRLLAHMDAHPEFVQPETRRNEVRAFVAGDLKDLSISRTRFAWGVDVPDHPGWVIWVWLDALTNYYSATRRSDEARAFWDEPGAQIVHMVGKEISRFHAVYWPAFLMAAGLPLPTTIYCHGWWTVDGEKMSKTLGNVVDPLKLSEDLGVDAFRYFVLREVPLGADGDFSHEALVTRYNAELANDLGNLLNRTLGMCTKYELRSLASTENDRLRGEVASVVSALDAHLVAFAPSKALEEIWKLVRLGNEVIDKEAPWKQAPPDRARTLGDVLELCRSIAHLVAPFMPERSREMLRQLGLDEAPHVPAWKRSQFTVGEARPLFPRIDDDRKKELIAKWTAERKTKQPSDESLVTFEQFQKLDLRVALIVAAEAVPKAKKLFKLTVDLGSEKRQVVAGIAETYKAEELVGKKVVFLANLKPATIRGVVSEGMILAAGDEQVLALSSLDRDCPAGTKVR